VAWPQATDYSAAVQNPPACFADAELRAGAVATADALLGLPLSYSGNFATVFKVVCPGGQAWAVKCFTRPVAGLRERYRLVSRHLEANRKRFAVEFRYLADGIRVNGDWYPVLKMRWVEGFTLNDFLRDHAGNPVVLEQLSHLWLRLGNVLLVPGRSRGALALRLVDYDGMWVPALAGRPPGETGHPAYQHPRRLREGTYGPEVDRFPLMVIYCAIRAVRAGGRALWERYDNGDNLLFRERDLRDPPASPLFRDLVGLGDPEVRRLADRLSRATYKPLDQTPLLPDPAPPERVGPPAAPGEPEVRITGERVELATHVYAPPADELEAWGSPPRGRVVLTGILSAGAGGFLCCLVVGVAIFAGSRGGPGTPGGGAGGKSGSRAILEIGQGVAGTTGKKVQYLSDMEEYDVKVSEGRFRNKGKLGYGDGDPNYANGNIRVKGEPSPNGLSMCPDANTYAGAKYNLGRKAATFLASVALNDSAGGYEAIGKGIIPTPLTFEVRGDGKVLWTSRRIDEARHVEDCEVDVRGVDVLELRINCPGSHVNAQAVWVEPRVLLNGPARRQFRPDSLPARLTRPGDTPS
jgi:hypothetical protein